jgi:hypothetical protein
VIDTVELRILSLVKKTANVRIHETVNIAVLCGCERKYTGGRKIKLGCLKTGAEENIWENIETIA